MVKDAKEHKGLFTLWSKDDKVWLELTPEQFDQLYFLQANLARGVAAETGLNGAFSMLRGYIVSFRRVHNNVQLIARNFSQFAQPGTPMARATAEGTSDSLLAYAPVASAPHPERKSVLVEANALLIGDIPMLSATIDRIYRAGYNLDRANSYFREHQAREDVITFDVTAHYNVARLPMPTPSLGPVTTPQPRPASGVPDPRSFFLGIHYTLGKLPEAPMRPRLADGRIGHFNQMQWDFGDRDAAFPRKYVINRWRLEKKDPTAALSEPKKPITFWLDRNIPLEYRETVREGVLMWNRAFERIGFKDAIRVEQQPDDATWSTHDTNRASVRWFVDHSDGALAVGPSRTDPRTGEILDADITIGNGWVALPRRRAIEQYPKPMPALEAALIGDGEAAVASFLPASVLRTRATLSGAASPLSSIEPEPHALCSYAEHALAEANFALDLLALRAGDALDPAEAERIAKATLRDVVAHEVGHALGLRHNFRASTIYTQAQINDPAFTRANGLSGSVMDYNAFNVALDNEPQGEFVMSTLGPYDYWAVEYAYSEFKPEEEAAALARIAAKSTDAKLAYGTDEEVFGDGDGMDPEVNQRDVGGDPLEFAKRRVQLSRELFARLQKRSLGPGEDYGVLTRNFMSGVAQLGLAFDLAAKHVGGVVYLRDQAGSGRAPLTPVPVEKQRAALRLITDNLFPLDGFDLDPVFASRLVDSALERRFSPPVDRSLDATVLGLQTMALDRLLSPRVAERVVNAKSKLPRGQRTLTLEELYGTLTRAIWGNGPAAAELSPARRALQREHAKRLATAITRPSGGPAGGDARALHRLTARQLLAQAERARSAPQVSQQTRAHLEEIADVLRAALTASVTRPAG